MKYYSLNKQSPAVDFKEATILGQAPDKGLYFPESIPVKDKEWIGRIEKMEDEDIAFDVISPYTGSTIPADKLRSIVKETLSFPIPLVELNKQISSLELFHGPTLAFKDIGARFMSRCLGYFLSGESKKVTVLVATSGDTGGAVANGFLGVEGVEVVILYPSGKVSPVQEKQLTSLGKNIKALEVDGSFDDCQQLVKQAFADEALRRQVFLTSANSINVARWLPQQFYYFLAWKQWKDKSNPPVISVPSGNFGNICAGILANASGLPVNHFIAACNTNDVVTSYLETGEYKTRTAVPTLSNAMDVGNPSNFVRILEIFHQQLPDLKKKLSSATISDEETMQALTDIFNKHNYLADPHGAVGYLALQRYLNEHEDLKGFFLETAHPVKFPDAVQAATGKPVNMPSSLKSLMSEKKKSLFIKPDYGHLSHILLSGS